MATTYLCIATRYEKREYSNGSEYEVEDAEVIERSTITDMLHALGLKRYGNITRRLELDVGTEPDRVEFSPIYVVLEKSMVTQEALGTTLAYEKFKQALKAYDERKAAKKLAAEQDAAKTLEDRERAILRWLKEKYEKPAAQGGV